MAARSRGRSQQGAGRFLGENGEAYKASEEAHEETVEEALKGLYQRTGRGDAGTNARREVWRANRRRTRKPRPSALGRHRPMAWRTGGARGQSGAAVRLDLAERPAQAADILRQDRDRPPSRAGSLVPTRRSHRGAALVAQ